MARKTVVIGGLSEFGMRLAYALAKSHNLYIFDPDKELCNKIAGNLGDVSVIPDELAEESQGLKDIHPVNVYVAAYDDSAKVLETSLFMKKRHPDALICAVGGKIGKETNRDVLIEAGVKIIDPYEFFTEQVTDLIDGIMPSEDEPSND